MYIKTIKDMNTKCNRMERAKCHTILLLGEVRGYLPPPPLLLLREEGREGGLSSFLVTEGDDVDLIVGAAAGTASS